MAKNNHYFGGKGQDGVWQAIINQIPPHHTYIEPFLGGASVMKHKMPATMNIGVDLSATVIYQASGHFRSNDYASYLFYIGNATNTLNLKFNSDVFIYCDPPYPHTTRSCDACRYDYELTDEQHRELLAILRRLPCYVAISTYPNEIYAEMLHDWRAVPYKSVARSGSARDELLYCNYPEPEFLHEYTCLGADANNRQYIRRRAAGR